jgi:hypothetical protein
MSRLLHGKHGRTVYTENFNGLCAADKVLSYLQELLGLFILLGLMELNGYLDGLKPLTSWRIMFLIGIAPAVGNALFQATTVRSASGTAEAIPIDRVRELLKR